MCEDRKSLHAKLNDELMGVNFRKLFNDYNIEIKCINIALIVKYYIVTKLCVPVVKLIVE